MLNHYDTMGGTERPQEGLCERDNVWSILAIEKNIMNAEVSRYWKTANSCRQLSHRLQLCLFFCLTTVLEIDLFEQELPLNLHFPFQQQQQQQHTVKPIHCLPSIRRLAEKPAILNKWGGGGSFSFSSIQHQRTTTEKTLWEKWKETNERQNENLQMLYICHIILE